MENEFLITLPTSLYLFKDYGTFHRIGQKVQTHRI